MATGSQQQRGELGGPSPSSSSNIHTNNSNISTCTRPTTVHDAVVGISPVTLGMLEGVCQGNTNIINASQDIHQPTAVGLNVRLPPGSGLPPALPRFGAITFG